MLVVLRGNSGSGKSTVAAALQRALAPPVAVLEQDYFRRIIYDEREQESMAHAKLLEVAANHCLSSGHHVVLEGILNATRYSTMLKRVAETADDARFYAFDLAFEETVRRHAGRRKASEFGEDQMRSWYHGWQPLSFVQERRIGRSETCDEVVQRILAGT